MKFLKYVVRIVILPIYVYWWYRLLRTISKRNFQYSERYISKIKLFVGESSIRLNLISMLVNFAIEKDELAIKDAIISLKQVQLSKRVELNDKRYLLEYINSVMRKLMKYEVGDSRNHSIFNEFINLSNASDEVYKPSQVDLSKVSPRLRARYPIELVVPGSVL